VHQRTKLPLAAVWLLAVLGVWVITTAVLAAMIGAFLPAVSVGALVSESTSSAAFASGVVGGPATAVALRVRRTHGRGRAVLSGLATGALIMLFAYSYLEATGTSMAGSWDALAPVFVVAVAEIAVAFVLRGSRVAVAGPEEEPGAEAED